MHAHACPEIRLRIGLCPGARSTLHPIPQDLHNHPLLSRKVRHALLVLQVKTESNPDLLPVLSYASTLARNNRYLHRPNTAAKPISGAERARTIGGVSVMI